MTRPSTCSFGNRAPGGESSHESRAISNYRTDNFPQSHQLGRELLTLKRTTVDTIRYKDYAGKSLPAGTDLIYQLKASDHSLEIKARGCTWHNNQTGGSYRRDIRSRAGCRIDDRVIVVCGDLVDPTYPVGNRLIDQGDLVNRKLQFARLGPSTRRPQRIRVNQGDTVPPFLQLRRHGDSKGCFPHTAFVLRYTNNTIHCRIDAYILLTLLPTLQILHGDYADGMKEQWVFNARG